jgi:Carboxypeptidase regulatory-like domain
MKKLLFATIVLIVMSVLHSANPLFGQSTAQIQGVVKDSSGATVPKATIKVTQTSVHLVRVVTAQADGSYVFPDLPIGPYSLEVSAPGFSSYQQTGIDLQVGNRLEIPVTLRVGSVNEQITVSSTGALVDTEKSSVSEVINERSIAALPLNGRVATQLVLLTGTAVQILPGNADPNVYDFSGTEEYPTEFPVSIGGGPGSGTNWLLDGIDNMASADAVNNAYPFPDALQEFDVETSSLSAREGVHTGGVVNMVTKSGSNSFHGDLFEFLRNGSFDGTNYFATQHDTLHRNQFGGTLGGAIIKNKLFFFGGYQGTINHTAPPQNIAFVPTQAMLNGDFSTYESAACQSSGVAGTIIDPTTGQPFPNDYISPTRFNSASLGVLKFAPVSTDPCGKIVFPISQNSTENLYVGRVDFNLSDKHSLFFRDFNAYHDQPAVMKNNNAVATGSAYHFTSLNDTFGDTYTISKNMVNSFRLGADRLAYRRGPASGFPGPETVGIDNNAPANDELLLGVNGAFNMKAAPKMFFPCTTYQISDDLDLILGRHHLSFGAEYQRAETNESNYIQQNGAFTFDGSYTGSAMVDFMLGDIGQMIQTSPEYDDERQNVFGAYIDDTFRINAHLTIRAGLRWEPSLPEYQADGRGSHFDMAAFDAGIKTKRYINAPPGLLYNSDPGIPYAYTNVILNNFEPRLSFIWDPTGKGTQTVRAGYARLSDTTNMMWNGEGFADQPPFAEVLNIEHPPGPLSSPYTGYPGGNPFPLPPPSANAHFPLDAIYENLPLHFPPMTVDQWNLSYERQLGANWFVSATYMGNKTTHEWIVYNFNPAVYIPGNCVAGQYGLTANGPCSTEANTEQRRILILTNPVAGAYYGNIYGPTAIGNGEYNSLLLSARHRFTKNFTMQANYTYSHCIDTNDIAGEAWPGEQGQSQNPYNPSADRGNCLSDRRQVLSTSFVVVSPTFGNGWQRRITSDWQLSSIISAQTGPWFTPYTGLDNSLTFGNEDRPNVVGNPYPSNQNPTNWINPAAFVANPVGTFGNAGRNSLLAPGMVNFDIELSRLFTVYRETKLEARIEAFNAFNHANFGVPDNNLQDATFGQVLSANAPRILELGLKYTF